MKIDEKELGKIFINLKSVNDKTIIDELYKKYNKMIYGIAFSILKNKEDSEDVVQSIFSKILTLEKEKFPTNNYAGWLYQVTKNEALLVYRKKKQFYDIDRIYEIEDEDNQINKIIDKIEFNKLISKLNNKEKEIISLKIISNLSFEEISKLLGEPSGTVKWRYYKSINTLKLMLSNLGMFIITFVIGLKTLLRKEVIENQAQDSAVDENVPDNKEEDKEIFQDKEETKGDWIESNKELNSSENKNEIDIKEETTVPSEVEVTTISSMGIGILSVSGIFLLATIIFSIILVKHQLKLKKKSSK